MRKLAVVISGAVSLGSYEAGVMYEVFEAISRHNEALNEGDEHRIEVDVITGASAGGMTACLLVQHLLCQVDSMRDPFLNPLYRAWVEDVDIRELLKVSYDDHKRSLLQSEVVDNIGRSYLESEPVIQNQIHPIASRKIYLGVAMSNLNGFGYSLPVTGHQASRQGIQSFGYTHHKDQFVCAVERINDNTVSLNELAKSTSSNNQQSEWMPIHNALLNWDYIRSVGLSSGAFPVAFQPVLIDRVAGKGRVGNRKGQFAYTDGGVFENEPIGMAKSLSQAIDRVEHTNERYYLYVAPGQRQSVQTLISNNPDIPETVSALVKAVFEQARFQDWILKEMQEPIYFITACNNELIGEVFSAFAGFLEEKFRAYDYNIGREKARLKLAEMYSDGFISTNPNILSPLEWRVLNSDGTPTYDASWQRAKDELREIAIAGDRQSSKSEVALDRLQTKYQIDFLEDDQELGQVAALKVLMQEVDLATRQEILQQLLDRLDSFLILANANVDKADLFNPVIGRIFAFIRKLFQSLILRPLLRGAASIWLRQRVLNVPPPSIRRRFHDYRLFLSRLWL